MIREHIRKAIDGYLDTHRDSIRVHVDKNVESTKTAIVEKLPDHVIGYLTKHFEKSDDGGDIFSTLISTVASFAKELSEEFKQDIRKLTRYHVDKATEGTTDFITDTAVRESKVAVNTFTEKEPEHHHFFSSFDLSFLTSGKEGIVNKIIDVIRPPIHRVGEDINKHLCTAFPKHIKSSLLKEFSGGFLPGGDKDNDGVNDNLQNILTMLSGGQKERKGHRGVDEEKEEEEEGGGDVFDKILGHLSTRISEFVQPFVDKFEEGLLQNLKFELHNHVFSEETFKKGVTTLFAHSRDEDDEKPSGDDHGKKASSSGGGIFGLFRKD